MIKKTLKTYIEKLNNAGILEDSSIDDSLLNTDIDCISYDNRSLHGNSIFVCKGLNFKDEYVVQAFENGAIAYVSEREIDGLQNCIKVNNIRSAIYELTNLYFDSPQDKIKIVGITGTKGKGSVAYILRSILDSYLESNNKKKCAIVTSMDTYDGVQTFESHLTTPETFELYEHIYNAVNSGIDYLVMEVSSQANKFKRTIGLNYEVACFNNFGKDHISEIEHPDIEDYFESKLHIFDSAKFACINSDSDRFEQIYDYAKSRVPNIITYGSNESDDVYCHDISPKGSTIKFKAKTKDFDEQFVLGVPGIFNVSNALAAISISQCLEIPKKFITQGLHTASIPGRMKVLTSKDKKIVVVVDYAHNQMSFNAFFDSLKKEYHDYNIISIFGCPGKKAYDRRKDLPEIASKYSKHIIICEEDSGPESFESISKDLVSNIKIDSYDVIEDRELAIKKSIFELADGKTLIAFTGKGEETRLKRGNVYEPCKSDLFLAEQCIEQYNKSLGM